MGEYDLTSLFSAPEDWIVFENEQTQMAGFIRKVLDWLAKMTLLAGYGLREAEEADSKDARRYLTQFRFLPVEIRLFHYCGRLNAYMSFPGLPWDEEWHDNFDPCRIILEGGKPPRRATEEHIRVFKFLCRRFFTMKWIDWDKEYEEDEEDGE